jgi:phosphoribosylaminoimidazole (AIR) synthetase
LEPTTKKAYAIAGVDIHLADKVKKIIAQQARTTFRSEVIGSEFFGSMFQLKDYHEPVLVSSTDGVAA